MGPRAAARDITPGGQARKAEGRSSHAVPRDSRAAQTRTSRLRGSGAARAARGGGPSSLHGVPAPHALHCGLCPSSGPPAWMASTRLDARGGAVMYSAGALAFRRPLALKVRSLVAVRCEGGTCDVFAMMIRRRGPARVERMCLKDTGVVKPGGGRSNLETSSCTHKNLSASAPAGSLSHNTRRVKRRQFKNRNTYICPGERAANSQSHQLKSEFKNQMYLNVSQCVPIPCSSPRKVHSTALRTGFYRKSGA